MATTYEPISTTYMKKRGELYMTGHYTLQRDHAMVVCSNLLPILAFFGCFFVRLPPSLSSKHWILENIYENSKYRYI